MKYLNVFLITSFFIFGTVGYGNEKITNKVTKKRVKTIILLDVSISFKKYSEQSCDKIRKYIDKVEIFEDVSLRKIGTNNGDENFIAELDMATGFKAILQKISIPCNQYSEKERKKCKQQKKNSYNEVINMFNKRKTDFLNALKTIEYNAETQTDIITPIKQCIRDFENSNYDRKRIIMFTDLHDETEQLSDFYLNIDSNEAIDEVVIFYAREKYADLWKDKLKGNNVKINHISITETGFNNFIEKD